MKIEDYMSMLGFGFLLFFGAMLDTPEWGRWMVGCILSLGLITIGYGIKKVRQA